MPDQPPASDHRTRWIAETDQLITAIVKLLAKRVAREIIDDFDTGDRP